PGCRRRTRATRRRAVSSSGGIISFRPSLVHMDDLRGREPIERCAARSRVRADIRRVDVIAQFHVRQLLRQADRVQRVTGWPEHGTEKGRPLRKALQRILAVIEDHAAERLIDTVVDVVTELAATYGLPDDLGNCRGCRGNQKSPRLSQNLDWIRKQT